MDFTSLISCPYLITDIGHRFESNTHKSILILLPEVYIMSVLQSFIHSTLRCLHQCCVQTKTQLKPQFTAHISLRLLLLPGNIDHLREFITRSGDLWNRWIRLSCNYNRIYNTFPLYIHVTPIWQCIGPCYFFKEGQYQCSHVYNEKTLNHTYCYSWISVFPLHLSS